MAEVLNQNDKKAEAFQLPAKLMNYINGGFHEPARGKWIDNVNPATGEVYSQIPDSTSEDVQAAVEAAKAAFKSWSETDINARAEIMLNIARAIEENLDFLAFAETTDNGKPLKLSQSVDIPRASTNFKYFAHAITQFHNESYDMGSRGFNYVLRKPAGVAGLISPWNLPLYLFSWKIAPALAAGNTCVAKPSEVTPMTAYLLSKICKEAGLPDGVLNIVHGTGAGVGAAIVEHPEVPVISFTGGTATGQKISSVAAPMFKKLSLELGGKNPNIVFADADFDAAVSGSVKAAFSNQGQICLCGSRIYVEKSIYDKFVAAFVEKASRLKIGDPLDPASQVGAIVSEDQFRKDLSYIDIAREEGGEILLGGEAAEAPNDRCKNGWFLKPTVITGLGPYCRTNQEEIFGPVVTIHPFDTEDEAIQYANSTKYGLSCTIWTESLKKAHRVAGAIDSGIIWINSWLVRDLRTPFGGMKQSGVGREGGMEALRFFTEAKNVFVNLQD